MGRGTFEVIGLEDQTRPEVPKIGSLADFDPDYFRQLEGTNGWIALGNDAYKNQRYFTVVGEGGEKLGIVGMYDFDDEKNITHTVVDQKYRGHGLALEFKTRLLDAVGEDFYVATVDLDNAKSLRAMEKMPGIKVVSDEAYEKDFHKRKYLYERPKGDEGK